MEISLLFLCLSVHTMPILAELTLGSASTFAALSLSSITNTGPSVLTGNVGTGGTYITGFPPGIVLNGNLYFSTDASLPLSDAQATYNTLATYTGVDLTSQDLGNKVLEPGTYTFTSTAQLTGLLTLSSSSSSNHSWHFIIGTALTTGAGSAVLLTGTARACDIYWQVGSSATIGAGTQFVGNVLAGASVTMNTGASSDGGLFALGGAVTLDTNEVSVASCAAESLVETTTVGNGGEGGVGGVGGVSTAVLVGGMLASTSVIDGPFDSGTSQGVLISIISTQNTPAPTPSLPPIDTQTTKSLSTLDNEISPTTTGTQNGGGLQDGNLASIINSETLLFTTIFPITTSTIIPDFLPIPAPSFLQSKTETEMQFPTPTQVQIAASMVYNSIESPTTIPHTLEVPFNTGQGQGNVDFGTAIDASQTAYVTGQGNIDSDASQAPFVTGQGDVDFGTAIEASQTAYVTGQGQGYAVLVTVVETFFSTVPCTSLHYPTGSNAVQNHTTITDTQGSDDFEIITIVSTHIITTTCTLPHVPITDQHPQNGGGKTNSIDNSGESQTKTYKQVVITPSPSYSFHNAATRNVGVGWCGILDLVVAYVLWRLL